jgi:hypothetical protein
VDDARGSDVESLESLVDHRLNRGLGHPGVVLEFHPLNGAGCTLWHSAMAIPHRSHETRDRSHAVVSLMQSPHLRSEVEVSGLYANTGGLQFSLL